MTTQEQHLENLSEIRNLMERSSRFISLSGLSGVVAGVIALIGAGVAISQFGLDLFSADDRFLSRIKPLNNDRVLFLLLDGLIVLVLSIGFGIYFTTRKAKQQGLSVWDSSAQRLMINLFLPLAAGGIFCLILLHHGQLDLVAPATLLFYGLALINASKYTLNDIRYLGMIEIALGLIAAIYAGYALLFWMIGFGVIHIVYGVVMYYKYER